MDAYAEALGLSAPQKTQPAPVQGSVSPQAGVTGAFVGNPANVAMAIGDIADPQERANALAAFEAQMRANGGSLKPQRDPYAEALGLGSSGQPKPVVTAAPAADPLKITADPKTSNPGASVRPVLANQITGLGANIVGGYRGLATLLTGGSLSDAANDVRDYVEKHTYTPPAGTEGAKAVESFNSPSNPITYIPQAADYAGEKVTDATGSPALGAAVNTGINALPLLLGLRGKPGSAPVEVGPSKPGTGVYRPLGGQPSTILPAPGEPAPVVPQAVPKQAAPVQAAPNAPAGTPASTYKPFPTPGEVKMPQPMPTTPEAIQAVADKAPSALFPETPTAGKFTPDEQLQRAKILESVGIDPTKLRRSAITGDATAGSTDFQTAKLDSQAGRHMQSIIQGERQALVGHAEKLIQETGGTQGVDQAALYNRGGTILAPLDKLNDYYDAKARTLYDAANERAQGQSVTLDSFRQVLADDSEMTSPDRLTFRDAAKAFAKKNGMLQEDGSIAGNALQAETFRKWLNKNRTHSNGAYVDALKESLDNDVLSTAGEDLYTQARALWQEKKATLDNPDGIAKLLQEEGVNRAVPKEMIAPKVVRMPVDQFGHIVQTLKNVPTEIQPAAQGALSEIRAQFANEVHAVGSNQAGQWNAKGVTKYLQNNAARMAQVFTPDEIQAFRNLNDAGHIVAKDQSYPGAAVQAHNLVTQGVMHGLPTAGAALGGAIGGPAGAAVGAAAGRMAAGSVDNAVTLRAVKKRTTKLSDLLGAGK